MKNTLSDEEDEPAMFKRELWRRRRRYVRVRIRGRVTLCRWVASGSNGGNYCYYFKTRELSSPN